MTHIFLWEIVAFRPRCPFNMIENWMNLYVGCVVRSRCASIFFLRSGSYVVGKRKDYKELRQVVSDGRLLLHNMGLKAAGNALGTSPKTRIDVSNSRVGNLDHRLWFVSYWTEFWGWTPNFTKDSWRLSEAVETVLARFVAFFDTISRPERRGASGS